VLASGGRSEPSYDSQAAGRLEDFDHHRGHRSGDRGTERPRQRDALFVGLFLLFWLGGWFVGFSDVFTRLLSGKANTFLFFWLGGWTLAGIAVALCLYRIFRPSVPETLRLMLNGVRYDSGVPPFQTSVGSMNRRDSWTSLFPKRRRVEIDRRQLRTLRLRETEARQSADRRRRRHADRNRKIGERGRARMALSAAGAALFPAAGARGRRSRQSGVELICANLSASFPGHRSRVYSRDRH
jgi:hypothetical protein